MLNDNRYRCTGTTKQGTPCRSYRVNWWGCEGTAATTCLNHLTDEERERFTTGRADYFGGSDTADLEPACWGWPPPTDDDLAAAKADLPNRAFGEEEYRAHMMTMWHRGRCAICGTAHEYLIEDHDHLTGLVRGRLCRGCNIREGMNRVGGIWAKYRERNPASICGVRLRYVGPFWDDDFEPAPPRDRWKDNAMRDVGL